MLGDTYGPVSLGTVPGVAVDTALRNRCFNRCVKIQAFKNKIIERKDAECLAEVLTVGTCSFPGEYII